MRLPFPERLPLFPVFAFSGVLFVLQQMNGTTLSFSVCTMLFILISTVAFNVAGGLTKPSGGYIFAYAILAVILGIVYKVGLGEPGQGNLTQPERTMEVYVGTAVALLGATYLARRFTPQKSLFPKFSSNSAMERSAMGCLLVGGVTQLYATFSTTGPAAGTFVSALYQLDTFLPLAVILGVTSEIRKSGGRRSVNATVLLAGFFMFAAGIIGYSKTGIFSPFACWFFAAAAQRYKVNLAQIAGLSLLFAFFSYYLVPYCQYGRSFRAEGAPLSEQIKTNILLLSNLDKVHAIYVQAEETFIEINSDNTLVRYYDHPQGFADRLQMIAPDDAIINVTENGAVFGISPTIFDFENNIPHFIWPGKPIINFGNIYAHEIGLIPDANDTTTGVSFSPAGSAYHQAKWSGVLILMPVLTFMLFLVTDSCCGDTRESPFALLAFIFFLHGAPEGGLDEVIHSSTFVIVSFFIAALLTTKLMPILANLVVGPEKGEMGADFAIRPQSGRFVTAARVQGMPSTAMPMSTYRWSKPTSPE